jgi:alpha-ribazole phosphatase
MQLWLVRHARPLIDTGICYGQLDVAADRSATRECAESLAGVLPKGTAVHCSTLQRCEQLTPELLGLRPDLTLKNDQNLREMSFGDWEGRRWDEIGAAALDAWVRDFAAHRPGGGESVQDFMARVAGAFDAVDPHQPTLWITHAGVIRAARLIAGGLRDVRHAAQWPQDAPGFGQWCTLQGGDR